jgi:hypothetical protein
MTRKTLDALLTAGGLLVAAILLVAGGLLTWAHSFVSDQVSTQLTQQQIFFPPQGKATASKEIGPYLNKYAGQQLVNGEQARAYADHFIAVHLKEVAGGQTYAQLSSKAQANPNDEQLKGQVQTMFRGETLRGLLLNAYAFDKMGQIALYGAIVSFAGAALMLILSLLGMAHLRRVSPDDVVLPGARQPVTVNA